MRGNLVAVVAFSTLAVALSINCYICNSIMRPECESDYEQFLKACPVKSFGGQKSVQPVGCRVIRQYIEEEQSVIRECAYSGSDVVGKSSKGSKGVQRVYTQCSEADACNPATTSTPSMAILLIVAFLGFFFC